MVFSSADFYDYKREVTACLPVGVILTLAATGSEMSDSSVITKEDGLVKSRTGDTTTAAIYDGWYDAVYVPAVEGNGD